MRPVASPCTMPHTHLAPALAEPMPLPCNQPLPLRMCLRFLFLCALALLTACASPSAQQRGQRMDAQATTQGWQKLRLSAGRWALTGYAPELSPHASTLTVYLEGDGLAWQTGTQPSDNPTPRNPVALALALQHQHGAVAYLARPCQNVSTSDWGMCNPADWTHARYAPEVVAAMNEAVSSLKARAQVQHLVLVGYSGGGAIATLLAAERSDVVRLVTVAANLDTDAWTAGHGLLPLSGSLNPAERWSALQHLTQLHLVGAQDTVVPRSVAQAFVQRFPAAKQPMVRLVDGADHSCCWAQLWPLLMPEAFP